MSSLDERIEQLAIDFTRQNPYSTKAIICDHVWGLLTPTDVSDIQDRAIKDHIYRQVTAIFRAAEKIGSLHSQGQMIFAGLEVQSFISVPATDDVGYVWTPDATLDDIRKHIAILKINADRVLGMIRDWEAILVRVEPIMLDNPNMKLSEAIRHVYV